MCSYSPSKTIMCFLNLMVEEGRVPENPKLTPIAFIHLQRSGFLLKDEQTQFKAEYTDFIALHPFSDPLGSSSVTRVHNLWKL